MATFTEQQKKEIKLIDKVLEDYTKFNSTDTKCLYCNTLITKDTVGNSYSIHCETKGCFKAIFRGI